jgi:DNA-binding LytR/AlgR family response regulator
MKDQTLYINCNEKLLYLEADVNYTVFHFTDGKKQVSSFTLKTHINHDKLQKFIRINRGLAVNPLFVLKIISDGKTKQVILQNGIALTASRRRLPVLQNIFVI